MLDFYNRSRILLMPTRWEGFSNVPAEAAHFGNVIIGTSVGGVFELTDEGRIGKLIPIDDAAAITKALKKFTSDRKLLERESKRSAEFCDKNYSWKEIVKPFAKELRHLR